MCEDGAEEAEAMEGGDVRVLLVVAIDFEVVGHGQ